jgi:hypothetical protein
MAERNCHNYSFEYKFLFKFHTKSDLTSQLKPIGKIMLRKVIGTSDNIYE